MSSWFIVWIFVRSLTASSINNCKYFGTVTGPLIPLDVCTKWQTKSNIGSYLYACDAFGGIYLHWFPQSEACSGIEEISVNPIFPAVHHCGGGICNHVTMRKYSRTQFQEPNMSHKNDSQTFIEYAFVTDCWDSILMPSKSWSLDCTSDSLAMKLHDGNGCHGTARNISEITEGCHLRNDLHLNRSFPFYNDTIIPNRTVNINDTYFEIRRCGDATPPWLNVFILGVIGAIVAV
eukprot:404292_1